MPKVPDPSAGGWQLNGNALLEGANLVLDDRDQQPGGQRLLADADRPPQPQLRIHDLDRRRQRRRRARVRDRRPHAAAPRRRRSAKKAAGSGSPKSAGWAVAFDTYKNSANPSNNFVGISDGAGTTAGTLHWSSTFTPASSLRTGTHKVKVSTAAGAIAVFLDGTKLGSVAVTLPSSAYIGFSGGTGGSNDRHAVSGLTLGAG